MKRILLALLTAAVMFAAAPAEPLARFLQSLSPALRQKASIPFSSEERFNWHYTPRSRRGVATGDLATRQGALLHEVLRVGLSESGYRKTEGILALEPILGRIEGSRFRDPDRYYFSLFGTPEQFPWGWRFEGHHLSINATYARRGAASLTPMFLGANPARVPSGQRAGWRVLAAEEDAARALLAALDQSQRRRATISARAPADIVTGTDRTFRLARFEGLPAASMNTRQRALLLALIQVYVGNAPAEVREQELAALRAAGLERVHFAWAGGMDPGQAHYYRLHGPTILIEYDNTQDGANHIHTVWRKPGGDFGDDLLAQHYARHSHPHP